MAKKHKALLIIFLGLAFPGLVVLAFLSKTDNIASAQNESLYSSALVCDQPIPIGETYEEMASILQDSYAELQNLRYYLSSANKQLASAVAALSKDSNVCDFSKCRAQVTDTAPDFALNVWPFGSFGFHIPGCQPKECVGEPCPDIEQYLGKKGLGGFKNGVKGSYEIVSDIFNKATEKVGGDIRQQGEAAGRLIRRPELAARKLRLARAWLHSSAGIKRSCSLSELERAQVAAGELNDVFPMRCRDAWEQGYYWPKPSSENCQDQCKNGASEECKICLAEYKDDLSPLAQINYKIYGLCSSACQNGLNQECQACICCKEFRNGKCAKSLSEKQCLSFICGGSEYNYVCCKEGQSSFEGFGGGTSGGHGVSGSY